MLQVIKDHMFHQGKEMLCGWLIFFLNKSVTNIRVLLELFIVEK